MLFRAAVTVAAVAANIAAAANTAGQPNIVFILADDLGYNELNFMNSTRGILTPNLDSLANSGVIMKNYYVQPICSPTRSALMTGRYTVRLGTQSSVIFWDTPWGIALNETFIPQNLKDAGYATAMFGKWHLGMYKQDYTPRRRGFDEHAGYYQGCESAFTHVSACCGAGSATHDQNYTCNHQHGEESYWHDPPYEHPDETKSAGQCEIIEQTNCIAGSKVTGKHSSGTIKFLGSFQQPEQCKSACEQNSTATDPCRSWAFYYPDTPQKQYAGGCFGRHDEEFNADADIPRPRNHIASAVSCQYPPASHPPIPVPKPRAKEQKGYDWFKSDPLQPDGVSEPDFSANHTNSAELIRDAAINFLGRHKAANGATADARAQKPFFLYLPFQNIHGPYTTEQQYKDEYANNTHGLTDDETTMFGYLTEMDHMVGAIVAALKANNQYENSVILFSSDNGAPPASEAVNHERGPANPGWIARNFPFRGHKALIWEGGTRVAGFAHSPRVDLMPAAARGTVSHGLYHVTDWLPTIVGLAGGNTTRNHALDGYDIWPSLSQGKPSPRTEMLYNINPQCKGGQAGAPKAGLRMGKYKVLAWCYSIKGVAGGNVTGPVNAPEGADPKSVDPEFKKGPVLYDLDADPSETTNLAAKEPAVLQKMLARLAELAEGSVEPMSWTPPYQGPTYECADCPLHPAGTGVDKPWLPWL